jgi:hypothetical protein
MDKGKCTSEFRSRAVISCSVLGVAVLVRDLTAAVETRGGGQSSISQLSRRSRISFSNQSNRSSLLLTITALVKK